MILLLRLMIIEEEERVLRVSKRTENTVRGVLVGY